MRVLYIGETNTRGQYLKGNVPSHWFYGAVEMERDGHDVVWAREGGGLLDDIRHIRSCRPDMVFIPNLNLHNHLLLLLLASFGLYRKPIYAYLHREPRVKKGITSLVYKLLLGAVSHVFFLSRLTMEETVKAGLVRRSKASVPGWGPDMAFYKEVEKSDNGWFVSTGKENRDFDTLIEAFRGTGAPLRIITAKSHNGANYESLSAKCAGIPNIEVSILDNSPSNYPLMVKEMATARALVCPLLPDRMNYCVGLSTIADAEGLGKPLLITRNPYHDAERMGRFRQLGSVEDWIEAINEIRPMEQGAADSPSIEAAYSHMRKIMF